MGSLLGLLGLPRDVLLGGHGLLVCEGVDVLHLFCDGFVDHALALDELYADEGFRYDECLQGGRGGGGGGCGCLGNASSP